MDADKIPSHPLNKPQQPILHIGFHKCASTFIQETVFPQHPEILSDWRGQKTFFYKFFFGAPGYSENDFLSDLLQCQDRALGNKPTGRVHVFSSEGFCGNMFDTMFMGLIPQRVKSTFPDSKIIILIREPLSFLGSVWSQYIQEGGTLSIKAFYSSKMLGRMRGPFRLESKAAYIFAVSDWISAFGKDGVLVLPLELLKSDPDRFYEKFYSYVGVNADFRPVGKFARVSSGYRALNIQRFLNRFFKTYHNNTGLDSPGLYRYIRKKLTPKISRVVGDGAYPKISQFLNEDDLVAIRRSNRALSDICGYDLANFGYDLD